VLFHFLSFEINFSRAFGLYLFYSIKRIVARLISLEEIIAFKGVQSS